MAPLDEARQKSDEMILVFVVTVASLKSAVEKMHKTSTHIIFYNAFILGFLL